MIDFSTEFGVVAAKRLQTEAIVWLTTVSKDGTPQPNPVWFYWDGETFLIYTQPSSYKLKNIARNPKVSLHLQDATEEGDHVVVLTGEASVQGEPGEIDPCYFEKYAETIQRLGWDMAEITASYSVALRVKPTKLRGF